MTVTVSLPARPGRTAETQLPAANLAGSIALSVGDMASPASLQAKIREYPGLIFTGPPGTYEWDMLTYAAECDLTGAGALILHPDCEILWNNPARGLFKAFETDGLIIEGLRFRQEFLSGIARPDLAWTHTLNAAGDTVVSVNQDMIDWIVAWNTAYGVSISTSETSVLTFKQRWDAVYTDTPFASLGQISASGRPSGLLLDGCSRTRIFGLKGNNAVSLINDQGGTRTGEDVYGFGTYVDCVEMPDDARFGYLGKGVAITIDRVTCNTNGTRDTGGAPHAVYVAGSPDAGNVNTAVKIGGAQARFWGIGPFIKVREASLDLGPMIGEQVQSMLGLVHCTGSVGAITSVDQVLNTEATGSGSKFVANFTDCYDMTVGRISAQHRASTPTVSQDSLRAVDINGADRLRFEGIDVTCNRLSAAGAMVRMALANDCVFGEGSLYNTGDTTVAMYECPVDGTVGGPSADNTFHPVKCSTLATIGSVAGSSRRNRFFVDPGRLVDGYVEGTTVADTSFGASNEIILTSGERLVPLSAAPSFLTRSNATLVMESAGDEDDDAVIDEEYGTNFTNGQTVTIAGRTYTARTALTGSGNEFKIATTAEGGLATSIKRLRAAINNETLGGVGSGVIWNTTGIHATFSGISAGRTLTVYAKTAGAASDGQAVSISGTGGAWTTATTSGGDGVDRRYFNATLSLTTGTDDITFDEPASAPEGATMKIVKADSVVGSFAFGSFDPITRQNDELRVVYMDGAWRGIYMPSVIRGISHGDVFIPEALTSAAINAEIARMGTRDKLRLRSGKTYDITAMLNFDGKEVLVDADGALLQVNANVAGMRANSGIVGPFSLTADYTPGDVTLTVASTSGLRVGSWLKIVSDAVDPGNRNEGVNSLQWRLGEWALITELTSTVITIASPLEFPYGLSGELTPADPQLRSTVETYTTTNNARVFGPAIDYFAWEGGTWEYEDGHDATDGTGWRQNVMQIGGYNTPTIDGVDVIRGYNVAFNLSTYRGITRDCRARNLSDKFVIGGSATNLGYGWSLNGYGETVFGGGGSNCRHVTTTGSVAVAIGATSESSLYAWGPTFDASFIGLVGGGQYTPPFGTHSDAIRSRHISCRVNGAETWMFDIRGRDNWLIDCGGTGEKGVRALTEWANSGAPDEPGCSGQGRANLTTLTVSGLDVKVRRDALTSHHSTLILTGESKIQCDAHAVANCYGGGLMEISGGRHRIVITGEANAGDYDDYRGIFTCAETTPTEFGITGQQGFKIMRGASVEIDATLAADTATMRLFDHNNSGNSTVVLGDVTATLNSNFSEITNGGTLTIDNDAGFTLSGFTGTRETRSYFHTGPSGVIEGSGFVNDLADDGYVNISIPHTQGVATIFLGDDPTGTTAIAMQMVFSDASGSTSERASLLSGDATFCEVIQNSRLNAGEGTDGKLVASFYNASNVAGGGTLNIKNRLGSEQDVYWTVTGNASFGSV